MGIQMDVTVNCTEVLKRLRSNREEHAKILVEARRGYVEKMRERLQALTDKFCSEKAFATVPKAELLARPPQGHLEVFDSAISLFESHVHETITISADAHRNLVENEWDWKDGFIMAAAHYSETARSSQTD
jgi:hypothetical protein